MLDALIQSVPMRESEYRSIAQFIYEKSGIHLGDNKQELVKTRLAKRLRALGMKTYAEYFQFVSDPAQEEELMLMINAVSTNFTSFYRERQHFDFLQKTALPDIVRRKAIERSKRLRVWCAASSTGEEPYTLALTLLEFLGEPLTWDVKVLCTDISTKVLTQAVKGVYDFEKVKTVPPVLLDRYFEKRIEGGEKNYEASRELKDILTFRRLNLMDDVFPFKGPFDFISCRNVMIYFDHPTQERVVEKLLRCLAVGGYLLIGHSENLPPAFRTRVDVLAPATYRKIK
jgi:chemotaxis protein methyltransferase CheR